MTVAPKERWFDDFAVGERFEFGSCRVTADEIVEFARRYDPQPFHTDAAAAASSAFGGLVASGWMTAALLMRMMCDHFIAPASALGSPGVDRLRWLQPVRPGDRLRARVTVVETRRSQSRPDRGAVVMRQDLINQDGAIVMTQDGRALLRCRP